MGETPFKLAFGTKVMIPIKVRVSSLKQTYYDDHSNDEELRLALDYLSEVRDVWLKGWLCTTKKCRSTMIKG